jgi:hypothetical protein
LADELPQLVPGYAHTPQAALAMLAALRRRRALINGALEAEIVRLSALALAAPRQAGA